MTRESGREGGMATYEIGTVRCAEGPGRVELDVRGSDKAGVRTSLGWKTVLFQCRTTFER